MAQVSISDLLTYFRSWCAVIININFQAEEALGKRPFKCVNQFSVAAAL
jgi:hypothetical protein